LYTIEDVTAKYSADHVTSLGSALMPGRIDVNSELYLMNGMGEMDNLNLEASQILVVDGMGSKPRTVAPKERRPIGTGNYMNAKRKRRTAGLASLPPAQNLGLFKIDEDSPLSNVVSLDDNAQKALGTIGAAVAAGVGLYALWFVAKPVLGFVGDVGKARRAWKNPPIVV